MKNLNWFIARINKRIYRDDNICGCNHCKDVFAEGLVICDEQHARYLFDIQNEYAAEGIYLNYRDKLIKVVNALQKTKTQLETKENQKKDFGSQIR